MKIYIIFRYTLTSIYQKRYDCITNNMQCFTSIMCTYNIQPIITLLLLCFILWIHVNLYEKNLLFRSHLRSPVYATAVFLVLIGRCGPSADPSHVPPPSPPPICLKSLTRDIKRTGMGGGGVAVGHLLSPVLRLNSLMALIHHICQ